MAASLFAEGEGAAAPENPELENELKYIEELVNNGYADFAEPLDEPRRCERRAAGRQQVVHDHRLLAADDGVSVHVERRLAVLEVVVL